MIRRTLHLLPVLGLSSLVFLGGPSGCAGVVAGGAAAVSVAHDRRTAGTVVEDESIEMKAVAELDRRGISARSHLNVTSYNRSVLICGEVPDEATRQQAEAAVRRVAEVRQVFNEAAILPASTLASRSNDTWLTTRAKTALFNVDGIRDFDPTRVKVVTERGIVYLMGLVSSAEAESVTAAVRSVPGVQKVVRLFEYIDR